MTVACGEYCGPNSYPRPNPSSAPRKPGQRSVMWRKCCMFPENWIDSMTESALPTPSQSGQWLPHAWILRERLVTPRMQSKQLTEVTCEDGSLVQNSPHVLFLCHVCPSIHPLSRLINIPRGHNKEINQLSLVWCQSYTPGACNLFPARRQRVHPLLLFSWRRRPRCSRRPMPFPGVLTRPAQQHAAAASNTYYSFLIKASSFIINVSFTLRKEHY